MKPQLHNCSASTMRQKRAGTLRPFRASSACLRRYEDLFKSHNTAFKALCVSHGYEKGAVKASSQSLTP